ncbi:MAG: hypothetical protein Q7T14_02025 [Aestuariivirga sp.]|nr:hypothetical protein [Aestuariivirga sp.]
MDMPFTFENAVVRHKAGYISPERLTTLKNIFETVCDEAAIPPDASGDRNALATKILVTSETIESEMMLVLAAMRAAMDGRR